MPDDDAGRAGAPAEPARGLTHGFSSFALFGEVVVVGLVVALAALPVLTVLPALAAGSLHLRRHLRGERDGIGDLLRLVLAACRGVWLVAAGFVLAALLLGYNVWLATRGTGPFGVSGAVSAALLVVLAVVALRSAGGWTPGAPWWPTVRAAAHRSAADLRGSTMIALALGLTAVIVWMLAPLALVVGGLLALAVLAVDRREPADGAA